MKRSHWIICWSKQFASQILVPQISSLTVQAAMDVLRGLAPIAPVIAVPRIPGEIGDKNHPHAPKKVTNMAIFRGYFRSIIFFLKSGFFCFRGGHPFVKMMDDFRIQISKMVVSFWSYSGWYIKYISGFLKGYSIPEPSKGKMVPPGSQFTIFLGWKIGFTRLEAASL